MSQQFLNKYEKEKRVIELHLAGKTIRELASELRISFTSISKIIKAYERKAKREESNQSTQPKKPPISTQAFKLFKDGKKLTDVAIDLQLPARKALKLWSQFLRLERMYECYEFYQLFQSHIPQLLAISTFIKMNKVNK
jgi:helix-turn-helix protein